MFFLSTIKKNKKSRGFTLIELLIVLSIFSLLASIVFSAVNNGRIKSRDAKRQMDMDTTRKTMEMYYSDNGKYPTTNGDWISLESPTSDFTTAMTPYLSEIPNDPVYNSEQPNLYTYKYKSDDGTGYELYAKKEGTENTWLETIATGDSITSTETTTAPGYVQPPVNNPPSLTVEGNSTFYEGEEIYLTLRGEDIDGDPLVYNIDNPTCLPSGATLDTAGGFGNFYLQTDNMSSLGPNYGECTVNFSANDGENTTSMLFTFYIYDDPQLPTNLNAISNYADKVELIWTNLSENNPYTNYVIYRKGARVGGVTEGPYTDSDLTPGMDYYYQIGVEDADGVRTFTENTNVTTKNAIEITDVSQSTVTIKNNISTTIPANGISSIEINEMSQVPYITPVNIGFISNASEIAPNGTADIKINDAHLAAFPEQINLVVKYGTYPSNIWSGSPYGTSVKGNWTFDEGSGTTAYDSVTSGNNLTLSNNSPSWVSGTYNSNALNFNGSNNYTQKSSPNSNLDIHGPITVQTWIKQNTTINSAIFVGSSHYALFFDGSTSSKVVRFRDNNGNGCNTVINVITDLNWHHIVAIFTGTSGATVSTSNCKIYVDGIIKTTSINGTNWAPGAIPASFSVGYTGSGSYFNGTIDDVRIMNVARGMGY